MKKEILIMVIMLLLVCIGIHVTDPVYQIKHDPNAELVCDFEDGERVVPKDKISGYIEEEDTWVFTNGYARNCRIERDENDN